MPPDRRSSEQIFDINLLDAEALDSPGGLHTALCSIESLCFQSDTAIAGMVMALSSRSHVLEYVFSGALSVTTATYELSGPTFSFLVLDEKAYDKLSKWIVSGFPTSTTPNLMDALSVKLLQRLSSSLLFAEYPSAADAPPDLPEFWRKVGLSFKVLQELEADARASRISKAVPPISRKKGGRMTRGSRAGPQSDSAEVSVPITGAEACVVRAKLLPELQSILEVCGFVDGVLHMMLSQTQYYLLVLRRPLVSEVFRYSYVKVNIAKENVGKEKAPPPDASVVIATPDRPPGPAFPMIQPMKASLYLDDIEGFGEWAILLSTRAQKDLRDVKRSDGAMFRIVMKKIKCENSFLCYGGTDPPPDNCPTATFLLITKRGSPGRRRNSLYTKRR